MSSSSSDNNNFNDNERVIEISPNVFMPRLAFGTYKLKGAQCTKAVKKALEIGYEHIDTASIYKNESDIGEALEEWMTTTKTGDERRRRRRWERREEDKKEGKKDAVSRVENRTGGDAFETFGGTSGCKNFAPVANTRD